MHRDAAVTGRDLRIGFDYWPAATHAAGIGRYLRELVRALAALEDGPGLALLDVGPAGEPIAESALGLERGRARIARRRWRARRGWLGLTERSLGLRAESWLGKIDLFHRARPFGPPRSRAPGVVALAELPAAAAELESLRGMAAVLVFGEAARRELLRRASIEDRKIHCVPVGCDHWSRELPGSSAPRERKRLLVLGSVRAGRGHVEVLHAFERLRAAGLDADLVICGRRGDQAERLHGALRACAFRRDVRWIDDPLERELPALVSGASVLVHLAREEWTAVTPLEAMSLGVAVVASRLPCFVEALGDRAEYVEADPAAPIDVGLDAALDRTLDRALDPAAMERRRGLARAFTWEANARATLLVYEQVAREQHSFR